MELSSIHEQIQAYKLCFEKTITDISFEEFDKIFFCKWYFYNRTTPMDIQEQFAHITLTIVEGMLRHHLGEIDYFTNAKGQSFLSRYDNEILQEKEKQIEEYYLTLAALLKQSAALISVFDKAIFHKLLSAAYKEITAYTKFSHETNLSLSENLLAKKKELHVEKKKRHESSIFS